MVGQTDKQTDKLKTQRRQGTERNKRKVQKMLKTHIADNVNKREKADYNHRKPKTILKNREVRAKKITNVSSIAEEGQYMTINIIEYTALKTMQLCLNGKANKAKLFNKGDRVTIIDIKASDDRMLFVNSNASELRNVLVTRRYAEYEAGLSYSCTKTTEFHVLKKGFVTDGAARYKCYMVCPCPQKAEVELWVAENIFKINIKKKEEEGKYTAFPVQILPSLLPPPPPPPLSLLPFVPQIYISPPLHLHPQQQQRQSQQCIYYPITYLQQQTQSQSQSQSQPQPQQLLLQSQPQYQYQYQYQNMNDVLYQSSPVQNETTQSLGNYIGVLIRNI